MSSCRTKSLVRKRKHSANLVLYLSASSDNDQNDPLIVVNGSLVPNTKKRYKCTYPACDKAYTKPSRLEEHERSHTGQVDFFLIPRRVISHELIRQRPFVCEVCNKSYLRDSHLQVHARTHLPPSARPFVCSEQTCLKRFMTAHHLRRHESLHTGAKPFPVLLSFLRAESRHHADFITYI